MKDLDKIAQWISNLRIAALANGFSWKDPHLTHPDYDEAMLEWWKGEHSLAVIFFDDKIEIIKVWGTSTTDMETIIADKMQPLELIPIWAWLQSGGKKC